MKHSKKLLAMALALTMIGGATACSMPFVGTEYDDANLLNKIAGLETQIDTLQGTVDGYESYVDGLETQIGNLQGALDGYFAKEEVDPNALAPNYAAEAYEMVKYIDATVKDRDALAGDA